MSSAGGMFLEAVPHSQPSDSFIHFISHHQKRFVTRFLFFINKLSRTDSLNTRMISGARYSQRCDTNRKWQDWHVAFCLLWFKDISYWSHLARTKRHPRKWWVGVQLYRYFNGWRWMTCVEWARCNNNTSASRSHVDTSLSESARWPEPLHSFNPFYFACPIDCRWDSSHLSQSDSPSLRLPPRQKKEVVCSRVSSS